MMKIRINTDNHIEGHEELAEQAEATVKITLGHLADHITRVEVHLSDGNSGKGGAHAKRSMMEARLEHHEPISVTEDAEMIAQALDGAAGKLQRLLDHTLARLSARQGRNP